MSDPVDAPMMLAALDLVRRTGAVEFELRYHDDHLPVVWIAVAAHHVGPDRMPRPMPDASTITSHECGAGMTPLLAAMRLCEQLVDGALCVHCHRPTMFLASPDDDAAERLAPMVCAYQYDPELSTFRRSCEGDT